MVASSERRELGEVSDLIARPCACRLIHESVTARDEHLADIGSRDSGRNDAKQRAPP